MTKLLLAENQVIKVPRSFELYTIGPEDSLESILADRDMTLEELFNANKDAWLAVGQTIHVK